MRVRIGLSNENVLEFDVEEETPVEELCSRICGKQGIDRQQKRIRIIHAGKIINDLARPLSDYGIVENDFVHCAVSDRLRSPQSSSPRHPAPRVADSVSIDLGPSRSSPQVVDRPRPPPPTPPTTDASWLTSALHSTRTPDGTGRSSAGGVEGTNNDFLWGIVLGFLLGLIMLVGLLDRHVSRRFRIGVLAGVGCNLSFGLLRSTLVFQNGMHSP